MSLEGPATLSAAQALFRTEAETEPEPWPAWLGLICLVSLGLTGHIYILKD